LSREHESEDIVYCILEKVKNVNQSYRSFTPI